MQDLAHQPEEWALNQHTGHIGYHCGLREIGSLQFKLDVLLKIAAMFRLYQRWFALQRGTLFGV